MEYESSHRVLWVRSTLNHASSLLWCCLVVTGRNIALATLAGKIQASRESLRTNQSAVSMDTRRTSVLAKQLHNLAEQNSQMKNANVFVI